MYFSILIIIILKLTLYLYTKNKEKLTDLIFKKIIMKLLRLRILHGKVLKKIIE
jgi:hypothetical protein